MSRGKTSQIGYLMEILGISAAELSAHLNMERTNVSKWKSGARPLLRSSEHYENIIDYLIEKNNKLVGNVLGDFFESIYKDEEIESSGYIPKSIRKFLSGERGVQRNISITSNQEAGLLYCAEFKAYRGADGRRESVRQMLELALKQEIPCEINIFEADQFEWALEDMRFFAKMMEDLLVLLNKGHKIIILQLFTTVHPNYKVVLRQLIRLSFHKNMHQYTMTNKFPTNIASGVYSIKGKYAAVGIGNIVNGGFRDIFTTVFTDKMTVNQFCQESTRYFKFSFKIISAEKSLEMNRFIKIMQEVHNYKEEIYISSNMLCISTMSEELLIEILKSNNLTKAQERRCVDIYIVLNKLIKNSAREKQGGLFFSQNSILEPLVHNIILQDMLTAVAGKEVTMSNQQYRRHFKDTLTFLKDNSDVKITLNNSGKSFQGMDYFSCFNKNNWGLITRGNQLEKENRFIFLDDPTIINLFTDEYDEIYYNSPMNYKDHKYVVEFLEGVTRL